MWNLTASYVQVRGERASVLLILKPDRIVADTEQINTEKYYQPISQIELNTNASKNMALWSNITYEVYIQPMS